MELEEFKTLWSQYDKKLDRTLQFNAAIARSLTLGKVESALQRYKFRRIIEIIVAFVIAFFLTNLAVQSWQEWDILLSAGLLLAHLAVGIYGSFRQIALVEGIDYTAPIPHLQKKLVSLRSHSLLFAKFAMLIAPLFWAYIVVLFKVLWNVNIVVIANPAWLWTQIVAGLCSVPLVIWFWSKLSYTNMHISWVSKVVRAIGGEQLASALQLLGEVEGFEKEAVV